jgi:hypothetical protein
MMQNLVDPKIHARIVNDFFMHEKMPIVYEKDLEGQKINEQGQFVIGPRYGPEASVKGTLHEMGHFAEREIDKLLEFPYNSWGFSYGKYWQIGTSWGYESQTDQSVRREQRVWAFQIAAQRHYEVDEDPYDTIKSATWLPAWCYYQPIPGEDLGYKDEKRKLVLLAKETDLMSRNEYTFEAMLDAWNIRIEKLKDCFKPSEIE